MSLKNFSWVIEGKLAGSALPGGNPAAPGEQVAADLDYLVGQGIRCLISLQQPAYFWADLCVRSGLEWICFPIKDFEIPRDLKAFSSLVSAAIYHIDKGRPVCAHCRAGVGRTGLLLACIVGKYLSVGAESAIETVCKSRPALDTGDQRRFVFDYLGHDKAQNIPR
jgi:protein-tyrosine phosphatase